MIYTLSRCWWIVDLYICLRSLFNCLDVQIRAICCGELIFRAINENWKVTLVCLTSAVTYCDTVIPDGQSCLGYINIYSSIIPPTVRRRQGVACLPQCRNSMIARSICTCMDSLQTRVKWDYTREADVCTYQATTGTCNGPHGVTDESVTNTGGQVEIARNFRAP